MLFLPTAFLSLLTLVTSSPLAMRTAPPFQGKGQLATLLDGAQVGCLTSSWQMTVNSTQCATFKATLVTQETPEFGTVSWTSINSTEGGCGYEVYPNNSGIENTQYILGCGKVARGFNTKLDTGKSTSTAWTTLFIAVNHRYQTVDKETPAGAEMKAIVTDPMIKSPGDFEIGWVAL